MEQLLFRNLTNVFGRRSIRLFKNQMVKKSDVEFILSAAMAAPSACGMDPWRFIVVDEKKIIDEIASGLPAGKALNTATLAIIACGDIESTFKKDLGFLQQDIAAAVQNMMIAARSIQLGSCWLALHPLKEREEHVRNCISIPKQIVPVCCVAIGVPDETKEPRTRFNQDYIHYNQWGINNY